MFLLTLSFCPAYKDQDDKEGSPPPPQPHLDEVTRTVRSRGHCHHSLLSQFVTISIDSQYSVETVCPGTAGLVCQPVTLTKGKSLLWLVAPVAGLATLAVHLARTGFAQSRSGAGGDNLSLARLSRGYLLMPGTPVHGTERPAREREGSESRAWAGPLGTAAGLGILHKGDSIHDEKKVCYHGLRLSCQCLSGEQRRM